MELKKIILLSFLINVFAFAYVKDVNVTLEGEFTTNGISLTPPNTIDLAGNNIGVKGKYLYTTARDYMGDNTYLIVVDVSNSKNPTLVSHIMLPNDMGNQGSYSNFAFTVTIRNNLAYIFYSYQYNSHDKGILSIVNIADSSNPSLISQKTYNFSIDEDSKMVIADGHLYIPSNHNNGIKIINIANSQNPALVGTIDTGNNHLSKICIKDNYLYVLSIFNIKIFDISNPYLSNLISTISDIATNGGYSMSIKNNYLFIVTTSGELTVVDVSNREGPKVVSTLESNIAYQYRDIEVLDNVAYIASDFVINGDFKSGLEMVDITSPTSPRIIKRKVFPVGWSISTNNNFLYTIPNISTISIEKINVSEDKIEWLSGVINFLLSD